MNCCNDVSTLCADSLCFGKFAHCALVITPIIADASGLHFLEVYGNHPQEIRFNAVDTENIEIYMKWLNENEKIMFKIRKPDDSYLTLDVTVGLVTTTYEKFCIESRFVNYLRADELVVVVAGFEEEIDLS